MAAATMAPCMGSRANFAGSRSAPQRTACRARQAPSSVRSLVYSSHFHLTSWDTSKQTSSSLQEALPAAPATAGESRVHRPDPRTLARTH